MENKEQKVGTPGQELLGLIGLVLVCVVLVFGIRWLRKSNISRMKRSIDNEVARDVHRSLEIAAESGDPIEISAAAGIAKAAAQQRGDSESYHKYKELEDSANAAAMRKFGL